MDNAPLSLQNFSSVFEIFSGYYLLLGTNKRFNDYFNISGVFRTWTSNYDEIQEITSKAEQMEMELLTQLPNNEPKSSIKEHKRWQKKRTKQVNKYEKEVNNVKKLSKLGEGLKNQVELHFGTDSDGKEESETEFYKFIKPFYIFFGSLSMAILAVSGFYDEWHRIYAINLLNWMAVLIYLFLLIQAIGGAFFNRRPIAINPIRTFIFSIIVLTIVIFTPSSYYESIMAIPYSISTSTISYYDLQIISIVALIFFPIVTHIFILSLVVWKHRKVESLKRKISSNLKWLDNRNTERPIQIPPNGA